MFRYLILGITWLVTGREDYSDAGWVTSSHLPAPGLWFLLVVPVVGGLIYGPLVYRFAPEARGHGVPEVMVAVARNGGRIPARVAVVKSLASGGTRRFRRASPPRFSVAITACPEVAGWMPSALRPGRSFMA